MIELFGIERKERELFNESNYWEVLCKSINVIPSVYQKDSKTNAFWRTFGIPAKDSE